MPTSGPKTCLRLPQAQDVALGAGTGRGHPGTGTKVGNSAMTTPKKTAGPPGPGRVNLPSHPDAVEFHITQSRHSLQY